MRTRFWGLERILLALFVASGFAGLIYQAIWSHYLGLTLGHAAYSQTLVLGIFMGGMAVGAWLVSRRGVNWQRLILAYAVVEILIGLAGLVFHPLFQAYTSLSQLKVYPALESEAAVRAWQWASAALLIAPQSILLGMTFPLMSGGYLRVAPRQDGEILGGLYFTNSIGAAFGALFATFVLLPWVGMPGAMLVAGLVNLGVGGLAWLVSRRADVQVAPAAAMEPRPTGADSGRFGSMMVLAAAITGASSFVYEIGWVRMLNQALGTTVHSFELMLAAFILGLAFGGLWIRRRSQSIGDPVAYAGHAQVWMGLAALVSIPVFSQSFRWVGAMVSGLPKTEAGYAMFSLGSGGIALLVMFPAAFFAGMTLPLFTMALLRKGAGESSIGRIYAANTLGAILGVVLAVHVLVPAIGLRLAVVLAAVVDIGLGLVLLWRYSDRLQGRRSVGLAVASLVVLSLSLGFGKLDPRQLASGVFRHGRATLGDDAEVPFLRDGKTATVAFVTRGTMGVISTNGKPDAAIEMHRAYLPSDDEITMVMLGTLPLAIHPDPKEVAVIGWGSGLTTHTLLGSDAPERVDTIEIERAMYVGASNFGSRVVRAYQDPRSKLHIDDARTYFSAGHRSYDVIVSEPSNPWVSGVASLFTREFYAFLRGHLKPGGVAVQWIQSYELDDRLMATMVAALLEEFDYVDVYTTNGADLVFVLSASPIQKLDYQRLATEALKPELLRVGLHGNADFQLRRVGDRSVIATLVTFYDAQPHSDFYPVVALEAPRARFMGSSVRYFLDLLRPGMPVLDITGGREPPGLDDTVDKLNEGTGAVDYWRARSIRDALLDGRFEGLTKSDQAVAEQARILRRLSTGPVAPQDASAWLLAAGVISDYSLGYLSAEGNRGLWIDPTWIDPASQPDPIRRVLQAYSAAAERDGRRMRQSGLAALEALKPDAPHAVREQMLVVAILGAIAEGDLDGAEQIERQQGRAVTADAYGFVRSYLLAWIDTQRGG